MRSRAPCWVQLAALLFLVFCGCAGPRQRARHPARPQTAPVHPMPPCLGPICVVPA